MAELWFDTNFINKFGGKMWFYKRNNGTDTWHTGVGLIKSTATFGQESNPIIWADGNQGPSQDDVVKTTFALVSPMDTLESELFLKEDVRNITFQIIMDGGSYEDSSGIIKKKFRFMPEVKINRNFQSEVSGREVTFNLVPQYNDATTFSAMSLSAYITTALTGTVVAAGEYYALSACTASASIA